MAKLLAGIAAVLAVMLGFFVTIVVIVQSQAFPMNKEQFEQISTLAQIIGGIATAVAAVIGLAAVVVAAIEIRATQKIHEKSSLKELVRDYGRLSMEWPEFANPLLVANIRADPKEFERYQQYVSIGLNVCEEAFRSGDLRYWGAAISVFVLAHKDLIESPEFQPTFLTYPRDFRSYVLSIIEGHRRAVQADPN